jgi:rhodanese-related sulfurtransferase
VPEETSAPFLDGRIKINNDKYSMLKFLQNLFKKNYEDLSGREFKQRFQSDKNAVLIDVRTPSEFKSGSIKGAKNIDVTGPGFSSEISKLDKSKQYFIFCRSGARSGHACRMMSAQGFKVINLSGGVGAWPSN